MKIFEVGGSLRDSLLGKPSKDRDFVCVVDGVAPDEAAGQSFAVMRSELKSEGFKIFLETPEFLTIRAHFPSSHPEHGKTTADFVLARKDGPSSDGRHPDFVTAGSLLDDLARRDFTMNAIARDPDTQELIDPHGGQSDILGRMIRCVGDPDERMREDPLRAFRALRFAMTKKFSIEVKTFKAIQRLGHDDFAGVSVERIREELLKMFQADTVSSVLTFVHSFPVLMNIAFVETGLWLKPTLESN